MIDKFDDLVYVLESNGYTVTLSDCEIYRFAHFKGKGVIGGFATEHDKDHLHSHYYFNGIVTVDNAKCWNKASSCPLHLPIPATSEEMNHLLERLVFWGSKEGYEASNDFERDESSLDL